MKSRIHKNKKINFKSWCKKILILLAIVFMTVSCKKENSKLLALAYDKEIKPKYIIEKDDPNQNLYGNWIGPFSTKETNDDLNYGFGATRTINLVIEKIDGDKVFGYSLHKGILREFSGKFSDIDDKITFNLIEISKDKINGTFEIKKENDSLCGTWENKKMKFSREFRLIKESFKYNPENMIDSKRMYRDEYTRKKSKSKIIIGNQQRIATNIVGNINASTKILTEKQLKNLKKLELEIIRNTIYARHGLSFKNDFYLIFEEMPWYIPVSVDVTKDLTEIEIENIKTLKRFEKYATDNYQSFGR